MKVASTWPAAGRFPDNGTSIRGAAFTASCLVHVVLLGHLAYQSVMRAPAAAPIRVILTHVVSGDSGAPEGGHAPAAAPEAKPVVAVAKVVEPVADKPVKKQRVMAPKAEPRAVERVASVPAQQPAAPSIAVHGDASATDGDTTASNGNGIGAGSGPGVGSGHGSGAGGAGGGTGAGSGLDAYLSAVRARIEKAKRYPSLARRRGLEGRAAVAFELDESGRPQHLAVRFADHPLLGEAAVQAVHSAAPFPAFPQGITLAAVRVEVPLRFTLDQDSEEE